MLGPEVIPFNFSEEPPYCPPTHTHTKAWGSKPHTGSPGQKPRSVLLRSLPPECVLLLPFGPALPGERVRSAALSAST